MIRIAYFRVSTADQSIESQRGAMGGSFDKEFIDEGVSGSVVAANRPGFAKLLAHVREGDSVHVYAVDRLGRDAIDVQTTVRALLDKGVEVHVHGLGVIAKGVGELILAVLAQVAQMERQRIIERTAAGREVARNHLLTHGTTHRGKQSMGRPLESDPFQVASYRELHNASISGTATHFGISESSVKRHIAAVKAYKDAEYVKPQNQRAVKANTQRVASSTLLAKRRD